MKLKFLFSIALLISVLGANAWEYDGRYGWPEQKAPKKIIVTPIAGLAPTEVMLLESLSGLAAQAVNNGTFDEMVWINVGKNETYDNLLKTSVKSLGTEAPKQMNVWELLDYLKKNKVVNGYVLHSFDKAPGGAYERRKGIDLSCNVATVYCGLLKGVLIDESLQAKAKEHKLKMLKDARNETMDQCFDNTHAKLNNSSALAVDPIVTNCRDMVIANKLMVYYDTDKFADRVLEWVKPLSPIMGWNCGDEDEYTGAISRWGHYNTASNWCWNLTLLSAVSQKVEPKKVKEIAPDEINWKDSSSFHSFVMTDGDNMQWTIGGFADSDRYFGNPKNSTVPVTWTLCPINLSVMSVLTWNDLVDRKEPNTTFVEYGGGYEYPDEFAKNRPNRAEVVREFARRINWHFNKLNLNVFGFIVKDADSKEALESYQIFAEEIENMTGMLVVQYYPYELGGSMMWVKNKKGIDIPVVSATYDMWEKDYSRPTVGSPDYVATMINRDALRAKQKHTSDVAWSIVHAWSSFPGEMSDQGTPRPFGGFYAVDEAQKLLIKDVKNVSANEILWRIRMQKRPDQTKNFVQKR